MKIASKAPKTRYYGGSESNDFRVATAVCEQNVGFSFIDTINDKLKRRELFKNNKNGNVNAERKEGITYQSKCGFDVGVEFIDASIHVQPISTDSTEIVFFDLEPTGLGNNCEIVQIAARFKNLSFNVYILPLVSIKQAAENFINFLKSVHEKILFAAHNCSRFDAPHLLRLINKLKLFDVFKTVVIGFIDTLPVLKKKLPNRVKEKKKFKLTVLAEEYLSADIIKDAHNATCDVLILQQLMELKSINISTEDLRKQAVPLNFQAHKIAQQRKIKSLKPSLLCFLQNKDSAEAKKVCSGISITMINKIAEAGISKEQILESSRKNGSQGISILLGQDVGGKPRVTKSSAMIKKLCTKISEIIKNNDTEFNKKDK
ncbi:uncharacterized protein LOC141525906 [Cotesia typhae]|uniref:uncharacterized protein LOC141525906 n=1 Tax=Cotesia typhae TaxID=2053667 RepID=UPI003D691F66